MFGRLTLFYAARNGDLNLLSYILRTNPPTNDGSTHEAARSLHAPALQALIRADHDPDFRSPKHDGRSALAELCLHSDATQDQEGVEEILDLLWAAEVQPGEICSGKTAMFYALANFFPLAMLQLLILRTFWQHVGDSENLFVKKGYCYSASTYVKNRLSRFPIFETKDIIDLLYDYRVKDVFHGKLVLILASC